MSTTYTKLRDGSWGLRINNNAHVVAGQTVTVTKKSGETKVEQVGRVLWSGDGVTLATILTGSSVRGSSTKRTWTGCSCGSVEEYGKSSDCFSCRHDAD